MNVENMLGLQWVTVVFLAVIHMPCQSLAFTSPPAMFPSTMGLMPTLMTPVDGEGFCEDEGEECCERRTHGTVVVMARIIPDCVFSSSTYIPPTAPSSTVYTPMTTPEDDCECCETRTHGTVVVMARVIQEKAPCDDDESNRRPHLS